MNLTEALAKHAPNLVPDNPDCFHDGDTLRIVATTPADFLSYEAALLPVIQEVRRTDHRVLRMCYHRTGTPEAQRSGSLDYHDGTFHIMLLGPRPDWSTTGVKYL